MPTMSTTPTVLATLNKTDIDAHRQELVRLDKQLAWLDGRALKLMSQDGQISDLDPLHEFMDFYHTSLQKLHERKSNEGNEIKRLIQRLDRLEEKVTESDFDVLIHGRNEHREMIITVHIDRSNIDVNLEVSYFISNCSCSASYDVRVNSSEIVKSTTQLTYHGVVVCI
ncbi:unnamed protein product [Rotaria socialis]|uniref:Uncharacterized protein n=1 Tax=Rotaria socialis TaxID=392032 RepID=A0A818DSL1_9BILA|nr:unnamed protein product [Rotaria socialis]